MVISVTAMTWLMLVCQQEAEVAAAELVVEVSEAASLGQIRD